LKVLFVTRPHIGLSKGGLQKQINCTAECLENRGVEILRYDPWRDQLPEADICHCFSTNAQMHMHVTEAKRRNIPVVISPVFAPYDIPLWKMVLKVRLAEKIPGMMNHFKYLKQMLQTADRVLPLHKEEARRLVKCFGISPEKVEIIPNGIDQRFSGADPTLFEEKYGIKDFILQVGSIDRNKNQYLAIKAMQKLPYKLVIIGETMISCQGYARRCREAAGPNVLFIGPLDHNDPMLLSAFAAAQVFILPSYSEVMPLVLYEAAQIVPAIIVSKNIPLEDHVRDLVMRADPSDVRRWIELIEEGMRMQPKEELCRAVLSMATWQGIADRIFDIYQSLLK